MLKMFETMKLKANEMCDRWRDGIINSKDGYHVINLKPDLHDLYARLIVTVSFGYDFSQEKNEMTCWSKERGYYTDKLTLS